MRSKRARSEVSGVCRNGLFLAAAARIRSARSLLGQMNTWRKIISAAGFVNINPTETDYFFGDVPRSVETLKDYILIYRRKL